IFVVSRLSCPSQSRITVTSTPAATRLTAVACRNLCGETRLPASDGTFNDAAATYCFQLEANARSFKRMSVTVHEDGFTFSARLSFQKSFQQFDRFGPEWTAPLLSSFAEQSNMERRLPANRLGTEVQRLLNAGAGVVKDCQQDVIALAFD